MRVSGLLAHCFHSPSTSTTDDCVPSVIVEPAAQTEQARVSICFRAFVECMKGGGGSVECKQVSYLLPFHTWLRETKTLHPWSQALDTPRGQRRWRSHRRTLSPTPRCRELQHGPHSISSCPQQDVTGLPESQSLTGHNIAPMCIKKLTTGRGWTLKRAWCRPMDLDGRNK